MRGVLFVGFLALVAGCKNVDDGDGEVTEAPRNVEFLGNTIRTPNVAGAVCGWLFDGDEDGNVDGSVGQVIIVGTNHDNPCEIVASGNPPEDTELEFLKINAQFSDLPWDDVVANQSDPNELWEFGSTYVADGESSDQIDMDAFIVNSEGLTELEAGGPPYGELELIENTADGLHFRLDGTIAYVNHLDGENQQANPLETVSFEWVDVATCPCPESP